MSTVSIDQLKGFADCLAKKIAKQSSRYELYAANLAKGTVKVRIFKGLDVDRVPLTAKGPGAKIGAYGAGYARARIANRRQVGSVDLQMTDILFKSIVVANYKDSPALMILPGKRSDGSGKSNEDVAADLENRYETTIFEASDDEARDISEIVIRRIEEEADKMIDECFPNNAEIKI